jgi:hypothetical protein
VHESPTDRQSTCFADQRGIVSSSNRTFMELADSHVGNLKWFAITPGDIKMDVSHLLKDIDDLAVSYAHRKPRAKEASQWLLLPKQASLYSNYNSGYSKLLRWLPVPAAICRYSLPGSVGSAKSQDGAERCPLR